jgi:hypothetical protein
LDVLPHKSPFFPILDAAPPVLSLVVCQAVAAAELRVSTNKRLSRVKRDWSSAVVVPGWVGLFAENKVAKMAMKIPSMADGMHVIVIVDII